MCGLYTYYIYMYNIYMYIYRICQHIHTHICELTDLETWGILTAVVAHLPLWQMAVAWAMGRPCCEGDEPIVPYSSQGPIPSAVRVLPWIFFRNDEIFHFVRSSMGTYRCWSLVHAVYALEIPENPWQLPSIWMILSQLAKDPAKEPHQTWSFRLGQWKAGGLFLPPKWDARSS